MNIGDYADWDTAYQHFNERLFDSTLPEVVFALHRHRSARGYASQDRYLERHSAQRLHELAMNPDVFLEHADKDTLSTLVHEMMHIRQFCFGTPGRGRYHNAQWADWMEAIGLMPSHTGEPGGKRTGDRVSHYIVPGGPFDMAADELLATGWTVRRGSHRLPNGKGGDPSKTRFSCPHCGLKAWAKAGADIRCGTCELPMLAPGQAPVALPPAAPVERRGEA
jgi:hypothetical protein